MWLFSTLIVLIGIHGLFVASEYAMVKITRTEKRLYTHQSCLWRCAMASHDIEEYLMVCQLGKTVALLGIGLYLGWNLGINNSLSDMGQVVGLATFPHFLLGYAGVVIMLMVLGFELPKNIAINRAERCADVLSVHMLISRALLWPLLWVIKRFNRLH